MNYWSTSFLNCYYDNVCENLSNDKIKEDNVLCEKTTFPNSSFGFRIIIWTAIEIHYHGRIVKNKLTRLVNFSWMPIICNVWTSKN